MRLTNNMLTRNYLKNLSKSQNNLAKQSNKMASGRRFERGSENVSDAVRALSLRSKLARAEDQSNNIRDAQGELDSAESNLRSINSILQTAQELMTRAMSDTYADQRGVISSEIEKLREQVLQFSNAQFGDKFIFSGTNNGTPPFAMDDSGKVTYNGIAVDDIYKRGGEYFYKDTNGDEHSVPQDESVYVDVGFGIAMTGSAVDPNTAYQISFSGLDILGCGLSEDGGLPNNLVELLDQASKALVADPYDKDAANDMFGHLIERTKDTVISITDIGTRSNFLEQSNERLTNDIDNMTILDNKLEYIDDATESMHMQMFQYTWLATLSFGGKVLPQSLMDYLR